MSKHILVVVALATLACAGPGQDDTGSEETSTSGTETTETTGAGACGEPGAAEPIYAPPGDCYNNAGCASCNCVTFRDNPPDPAASCAEPGAAGSMRVTATLFEFPGSTPIAGRRVTIHNAFQVGTLGIMGAPSVAEADADAMGRFEVTIVPEDSIGMVAIVQADGFRATATGLAKPPYEPSNAIHDIFAVREADLVAWSEALAHEAAFAEFLPLGESGGVVGVARNRYTGAPMAGLRIVSKTNGASTSALVRYLQEDGTFGDDATSSRGVYVLVNPALAEEFEAEQDGTVVSTRANKAGSGAPGVFTMNLTIDTDPGSNPFE